MKALVLDIGGVLEYTPATGWAARWEERLGLASGAVEARMADVWEAGALGRIDETAVRERVALRLGLDAAGLDAFMDDLWAEYLGTPNTELIALVRRLRGRCRLGILSNSFVGAREREAALYGFDTLVEHLSYSHETGLAKPDPRAYAAVCEALGVRPRDCLFVDDAPPNIVAAEAAGMSAHLFTDNAGTLTRIRAHLYTEA
ncbi:MULTISPECIES: HAD-IA family hydrolase [unclassified Streptomyces]|uniref:HAD-IA family hydrolase n=1 Tax=unclassified Streptomyces TaxID=2593676 RepID=UPI00081DA69B|nr:MULTISPECIES: HAD-IA family hydrolase [unclassified Streptomyces]MYR27243.1 HAD-IA family hydrolase [Streptomyces sp. SID4945]SCF20327.1 putative hydrolase of the HAD superfamily [Streptomyces sp. LcepLS]